MNRNPPDNRRPFDPAKAARDRAAALEAQTVTAEPMTIQQRMTRSKPGLRPVTSPKRADD